MAIRRHYPAPLGGVTIATSSLSCHRRYILFQSATSDLRCWFLRSDRASRLSPLRRPAHDASFVTSAIVAASRRSPLSISSPDARNRGWAAQSPRRSCPTPYLILILASRGHRKQGAGGVFRPVLFRIATQHRYPQRYRMALDYRAIVNALIRRSHAKPPVGRAPIGQLFIRRAVNRRCGYNRECHSIDLKYC